LSSFAVSSGQPVTRGALIAAVGCTGYCTGPHLHFEVRVNGTAVDPMPFLE
jgi:murein DD-endopeptidase MepM/ murein hydrolase activator NlpD